MQTFFWITGGLLIAGFGLLSLVMAVVLIFGSIKARRERLNEAAVEAVKTALGRDLASLRRWFSEWPEIESLIDLMGCRLGVYGCIEGGELRRDWIAKMEKLQNERRKKQDAEWDSWRKNAVPAEAATDEPISPLGGERL